MKEKLRLHIEKTVSLTDEEFESVLSHFTFMKFEKGDFLFGEGEKVNFAYFILSGLTKLLKNDESGKQHIVAFAMEDWWESDFAAFFNQSKATLSLQCLEVTEVLCLSHEDFQQMLKMKKMEYFFREKSNAGQMASQQRILSFLSMNAKERYDQLLEKYPSLFQRVSKNQIAAYLGVSRETLSRLSS